MKKISVKTTIFLLLILTVAFMLFACNRNGDGDKTEFFSVSYKATVGGTVSGELNQTVEKGCGTTYVTAIPDLIIIPATITKYLHAVIISLRHISAVVYYRTILF